MPAFFVWLPQVRVSAAGGVDYVHGFMGTRDNSFTFNAG
jgi:hypothetical protein